MTDQPPLTFHRMAIDLDCMMCGELVGTVFKINNGRWYYCPKGSNVAEPRSSVSDLRCRRCGGRIQRGEIYQTIERYEQKYTEPRPRQGRPPKVFPIQPMPIEVAQSA